MTKRIEGSVTHDPQTFDVQNRLVSVNRVGTGTTTFAYDAAGIRVKSVHPGGKTSYFPLRPAQSKLFPGYEADTLVPDPSTRSSKVGTFGTMARFRRRVTNSW